MQQQQVNVRKKQLRAPFAGRAGIVTINPGTLSRFRQDDRDAAADRSGLRRFHLPQKNLAELHVGQKIDADARCVPGKTFEGTVSAINPKVDSDTRNVQIEATVPNPDRVLAPGMFANVSVDVGEQQRYLTLPQTAIVYNPYGETVYVVKKKSEFDKAQAALPRRNDAAAKADAEGRQGQEGRQEEGRRRRTPRRGRGQEVRTSSSRSRRS